MGGQQCVQLYGQFCLVFRLWLLSVAFKHFHLCATGETELDGTCLWRCSLALYLVPALFPFAFNFALMGISVSSLWIGRRSSLFDMFSKDLCSRAAPIVHKK